MQTVRYRGGYSFTHNEHGDLEEGDIVDIGDYTFEQFGQMFVHIDEETDHTADETAEADSHETPADGVDESSEWDEDEWLNGNYTDREDLVRTGAVDQHLDSIEAVETSDTVRDAVVARRETLADESAEPRE